MTITKWKTHREHPRHEEAGGRMTTPDPLLVSDDVRAIEQALDAGPEAIFTELYGDRYMRGPHSRADLTCEQDRLVTACNPARLRRILDTMRDLAASLDGLVVAMENIGGEHVTGLEGSEARLEYARAVLTLYRGEAQ